MGHFGFSLVGATFLAALLALNLLWSRTARPAGMTRAALRMLEQAGQVLTATSALVFADTPT